MSPDKDKQIFERWPQFFKHKDNPMLSGIAFGIRCADGWYEIIIDLCAQLEPLAAELERAGEHLEVEQIKSKFGNLRFHNATMPSRRPSKPLDSAAFKPVKHAENRAPWPKMRVGGQRCAPLAEVQALTFGDSCSGRYNIRPKTLHTLTYDAAAASQHFEHPAPARVLPTTLAVTNL